ncbi:MAG: lamin tail domain-containing protein [Chryseobacterium sp.]|nr:lamin tail domain-containing protein [Chryseobacterium sp.]
MKKIFTILGVVSIATVANAQIVINEVYGGGGNSGSTYKNDFVELINRGASAVTLNGATLQYASSAGTFNQYHPLPNITLAPGQKYLVQEAAGTGGSVDLPTPDYVAPIPTNFGSGTNSTPGFAMAAANGKIALVSNDSQISTPTDANVVDFVGYGTASQYEGSGAAPALSATLSASRTNGIDTNNNAADFTTAAPSPQNSVLAVSDVVKTNASLVRNTVVGESIAFAKTADIQIINAAGQVVKTAKVTEGSTLNVSSLAKGVYIVTGSVNGEKVSQKVIKN